MKKAIVKLKSVAAYSQGRFHQTAKLPKELPADYEHRTWREKLHVDKDNNVVIPGTQFAGSLREAAKYLSIQVPGKGKSTFTKHFDAGVMVTDDIKLPIKKDDALSISVFVPSDGKAGGGKRVIKHFPVIPDWEGEVTFYVVDDIITADVFEQVLKASGQLVGIGVWRPRNRGLNGRFEVVNMKWIE